MAARPGVDALPGRLAVGVHRRRPLRRRPREARPDRGPASRSSARPVGLGPGAAGRPRAAEARPGSSSSRPPRVEHAPRPCRETSEGGSSRRTIARRGWRRPACAGSGDRRSERAEAGPRGACSSGRATGRLPRRAPGRRCPTRRNTPSRPARPVCPRRVSDLLRALDAGPRAALGSGAVPQERRCGRRAQAAEHEPAEHAASSAGPGRGRRRGRRPSPAAATISGEGVSPAATAAASGSPPGSIASTARAEAGRAAGSSSRHCRITRSTAGRAAARRAREPRLLRLAGAGLRSSSSVARVEEAPAGEHLVEDEARARRGRCGR